MNITLKKIVLIAISCVAIGVATTLILVSFLSVKPLKKENREVKSELQTVSAKYSASQSELTSTNENPENTSCDEKDLKADASSQEQELANIKQEIENCRKELATNQSALEKTKKELTAKKGELDKAKSGVEKFQEMDGLIEKFDSQCLDLDEMLNGIMIENATDNYDELETLDDMCCAKCNEIKSTYAQMRNILKDLK